MGQRTEFSSPQPGIQKGQDNGLITVGTRTAHGESPAVGGFGFPRIKAGFDQFLDILFGKCLNFIFWKLGWCDLFGRVGVTKFFAEPGIKGPHGNINISQGFRRKRFGVPIPAFGFVFGSHPGNVINQISGADIFDILISDMIHPLVQIVFIGVDRALA